MKFQVQQQCLSTVLFIHIFVFSSLSKLETGFRVDSLDVSFDEEEECIMME
jgi:hypothetical protein